MDPLNQDPLRPVPGSLGDKMRRMSATRQVLFALAIIVPTTAVLLLTAIGLVILLNPRDLPQQVSIEAILNGMLVTLVVLFFPRLQRVTFQRMTMNAGAHAAPPLIIWPWTVRVRHILLLLFAMGGLLFLYAPLNHQAWINQTLSGWASGSASFSVLINFAVAFVPLILGFALVPLFTHRRMTARRHGLLAPEEEQAVLAEANWLGSFATAFAMSSFICWFAGHLILRYLG